ncbi:MAG: tetratricopeptide repeat protein [Gemmatimonadota bacterium]|nr:tetratricopeptide repeat protein [Gemmatimonadota bacterium]
MPGYKALPIEFSGPAAEHVRYAEVLQRAGDPDEAVRMLETTLDLYALTTPELPGWLCGRLAALYRALKRYDDEVTLLERYRESQSSEEARTRFDARLSKARAIAERKRRTDTRALSSVRRVINGYEDADTPKNDAPFADDDAFPAVTAIAVREALVEAALNSASPGPAGDALAIMCAYAHQQDHPPERLVAALKEIWRGTPRPERIDVRRWETTYRSALGRVLTLYFEGPFA